MTTHPTTQLPFPESLRLSEVRPGENNLQRVDYQKVYHNRAVTAFIGGGRLHRAERAILGLARGIETYVGSCDSAGDPFFSREVVVPLVEAFRTALNGERGRLDGAALCEWASSVLVRVGIDPDTLERR